MRATGPNAGKKKLDKKEPAKKKKDTTYLRLRIDTDLYQRLIDYRFANRFEKKEDAARHLLAWALDNEPPPPAL